MNLTYLGAFDGRVPIPLTCVLVDGMASIGVSEALEAPGMSWARRPYLHSRVRLPNALPVDAVAASLGSS